MGWAIVLPHFSYGNSSIHHWPWVLEPNLHNPLTEVFSSAEKFEEWFSLGDGGKEKEAEVVQQLHKVRCGEGCRDCYS